MTADFRGQENMIQQFRGEHAFLSNFYLCSVLYNGITFTNTEAAFQAQKTTDPEQQKAFADLSPAKAKSNRQQTASLRTTFSIFMLFLFIFR